MIKNAALISITILLTACATTAPAPLIHPAKNAAQLGSVALGTDKAEVLKTFGAPIKIEIENKKFKYTYFRSRTSKVTIHFDEENKVASVTQ